MSTTGPRDFSRRWRSESRRSLQLVDEVGDGVHDARGLVRERLHVFALRHTRQNQIVSTPASTPARTSVSMRSPIMTVDFECAPSLLRPSRIMTGLGLPTKYGLTPVVA